MCRIIQKKFVNTFTNLNLTYLIQGPLVQTPLKKTNITSFIGFPQKDDFIHQNKSKKSINRDNVSHSLFSFHFFFFFFVFLFLPFVVVVVVVVANDRGWPPVAPPLELFTNERSTNIGIDVFYWLC